MKKKGYSIYKKTIFFLVFAEVSCIFLMVTGYTTASNIMEAGNPHYDNCIGIHVHNYRVINS